MIFTEFRFLFFFLVVFCIYWSLHKHKYRKFWLLICSYIFYGVWDWRFLSLIFISTVIDYIVGLMLARPPKENTTNEAEIESISIVPNSPFSWWNLLCSQPLDRDRRLGWLIVSLVGNLGILGVFKYYNFFTDSAAHFFDFLGLPLSFASLNIILPAGISFYTFQTLSYSLDIYRGRLKPTHNFWDFALFVSFFPQLVAGPIVRAVIFLPQLLTPKTFDRIDVRSCLMLFLGGYIKKACISDNLSFFVNRYFHHPELYTVATCWVATLFFVVQVYCDFAGYSDMAIASAGLLGYELPQNFRFPYLAGSITELWRRWHITMSNWFRDYLYVPLMRRREKKERTKLFSYSNLVFTMLITGLWHGAAWHFVLWGGLNGVALVIHREWSNWIAPHAKLREITNGFGLPLTFYWFCASAIFFRSQDVSVGFLSFKAFVFFQATGTESFAPQVAWILLPLAIAHWINYKGWLSNWWQQIPSWSFAACYGLSVLVVLPCTAINYRPFIYFQF